MSAGILSDMALEEDNKCSSFAINSLEGAGCCRELANPLTKQRKLNEGQNKNKKERNKQTNEQTNKTKHFGANGNDGSVGKCGRDVHNIIIIIIVFKSQVK